MSDSVDRVFSHALNTVNKIPTGNEKPPPKIRLTLYGLYKQSMEGNVEGIMERPAGRDSQAHQAREKWDAWKSCAGLSRTEAKRRYITTLISTMRQYASSSPDSRALVDELEFVWDQVKSNVSSSSGSSPTHGLGISTGSGAERDRNKLHRTTSQSSSDHAHPNLIPLPKSPSPSRSHSTPLEASIQIPNQPVFSYADRSKKRLSGLATQNIPGTRTSTELRHLTGSPLSQSVVDDSDSGSDNEGNDEFVDAQDSQAANDDIAITSPNENSESKGKELVLAKQPDENKQLIPKSSSSKAKDDAKWKRRVSTALVKLTAEVAALREQLEARRLWTASRRGTLFNLTWTLFTTLVKHVAFDLVILTVVLLWMRRKKDGRLEGAIRVLLGDAVVQLGRVGEGVQREVQKVGRKLAVAGSGVSGGRKSSG